MKSIKAVLFTLFPFACLLVLAISLWNFTDAYLEYKAAKEDYDKVLSGTVNDTGKEKVVNIVQDAADIYKKNHPSEDISEDGTSEELPETETVTEITYPDLDIGFDDLKGMNSDFVGILHIPVLKLTYPVVHSHDNQEYLHQTFSKMENASGCIFLDYAASADFSNKHSIIFGHNMKNGTMFGSLKEFMYDETLCDQDPYLYIYTEEFVKKYKIFAYRLVTVKDELYDLADRVAFQDAEYENLLNDILKFNYKHGECDINFSAHPDLITLSTCWGTDHTHFLVVHAALIGTVKTKE